MVENLTIKIQTKNAEGIVLKRTEDNNDDISRTKKNRLQFKNEIHLCKEII